MCIAIKLIWNRLSEYDDDDGYRAVERSVFVLTIMICVGLVVVENVKDNVPVNVAIQNLCIQL